jgi:hypothetical protein
MKSRFGGIFIQPHKIILRFIDRIYIFGSLKTDHDH